MTSDDANKNAIKEAGFRLAERSLESQTTLALASDQRSVTFCGILVASIAILVDRVSASNSDWWVHVGVLLLGLGAVFSALASRSAKIYSNVYEYSGLEEDILQNRPISDVYDELAKHFEESSHHNRKLLKRNGQLFNWALVLACLGFFAILTPSFSAVAKIVFGN